MKRDLKAFAEAVFAADHNHCRYPGCDKSTGLDPHHIRSRSLGGDESLENGITLCRFHHDRAENGFFNTVVGRRITAQFYMIGILIKLEHQHDFRWKEVLAWLENHNEHKEPCK